MAKHGWTQQERDVPTRKNGIRDGGDARERQEAGVIWWSVGAFSASVARLIQEEGFRRGKKGTGKGIKEIFPVLRVVCS